MRGGLVPVSYQKNGHTFFFLQNTKTKKKRTKFKSQQRKICWRAWMDTVMNRDIVILETKKVMFFMSCGFWSFYWGFKLFTSLINSIFILFLINIILSMSQFIIFHFWTMIHHLLCVTILLSRYSFHMCVSSIDWFFWKLNYVYIK